jgi:hypothetical protein
VRRYLLFPVMAVIGVTAWSVTAHPWGWAYALGVHPYPASSSTPWTYQMWSGIIPAMTVLTLFGAVISLYHVHNCAMEGCWRIGKHRVGGTPWCSRHVDQVRPQRSEREILEQIASILVRITDSP